MGMLEFSMAGVRRGGGKVYVDVSPGAREKTTRFGCRKVCEHEGVKGQGANAGVGPVL